MYHPKDRTTHTMAFVTPVVEHWLEWEIALWVHHEGLIRWSIAPWANAELHFPPLIILVYCCFYLRLQMKMYIPHEGIAEWTVRKLSEEFCNELMTSDLMHLLLFHCTTSYKALFRRPTFIDRFLYLVCKRNYFNLYSLHTVFIVYFLHLYNNVIIFWIWSVKITL